MALPILPKRPRLSQQPFRFFNLSPELRNNVYKYMTKGPRQWRHSRFETLGATVSTACQLPLLVVSHRFQDEYEAKVYRDATLTILGRHVRALLKEKGSSTSVLGLVRHLIIRVENFTEDKDVIRRIEFSFTSLPSVRTLHMQFAMHISAFQHDLINERMTISELFERPTTKLTSFVYGRTIATATQEVILSSRLFHPNGYFSVRDLVDGVDVDFGNWLEVDDGCRSRNWIRYRATLAVGPPAWHWHGLQLETIAVGGLDIEAAYESFREKFDDNKHSAGAEYEDEHGEEYVNEHRGGYRNERTYRSEGEEYYAEEEIDEVE